VPNATTTPKKAKKKAKKKAVAPIFLCRFLTPRGALILRYTPKKG